MKKSIYFSLLFTLITISGFSQATLQFRYANPHIVYTYNDTYGAECECLVWDIEMQASAANTRYWALQVIQNYNSAALTDFEYVQGTLGCGTLSTRYTVTFNSTGGKLNLAITSNQPSTSTTTSRFMLLPTTWTQLGTFKVRITDPTAIAGINFVQTSMNNQEFEKLFASPWTRTYASPNGYEANDLTSLYLGRVYSEASGWSQIGGTTVDAIFLDWNENVNTSVWEGTPSITQIDNTPALTSNLRIHNGAVLIIPAAKWLTVSGTLYNADVTGLVIESGGSLKHNTADVPATIKKSVSGSTDPLVMKYHFVSVPLTASSGATTGIFEGAYLYDFVESNNTWHSMGAATNTPLDVSKGYMTYFIGGASTTNIFSGAMNNGAFTATTSFTDANPHGFNLVPNPYPSAIDWLTGSWTKTNIENATYIWSPGANAATSNYASFVGGIGINGGTQFIPVGQSFFVHASAATPVLSMDNSVRVHSTQAFWKEGEVIPNVLRITSTANDATDETVVRFSESATEGFDSDWDAYKLQGGSDAPQLNSVAADNSKLGINSLPFSASELFVPIDFALNASTNVTFMATGLETFEGEAIAFLEDKMLNNMIDLRENQVYSFAHNPGNETARFVLHFYGVNGTGELDVKAYQIWSVPGKVNVHIPAISGQKATIEIYDLLGHLAVNQQVTLSAPSTVNIPDFVGIAVVRVVSGDQVFTTKVFIR